MERRGYSYCAFPAVRNDQPAPVLCHLAYSHRFCQTTDSAHIGLYDIDIALVEIVDHRLGRIVDPRVHHQLIGLGFADETGASEIGRRGCARDDADPIVSYVTLLCARQLRDDVVGRYRDDFFKTRKKGLAALDRLLALDLEDGSLELLLTAPLPLEGALAIKALAHWLTTGLPLVLAAPFLGVMLQLLRGSVQL